MVKTIRKSTKSTKYDKKQTIESLILKLKENSHKLKLLQSLLEEKENHEWEMAQTLDYYKSELEYLRSHSRSTDQSPQNVQLNEDAMLLDSIKYVK